MKNTVKWVDVVSIKGGLPFVFEAEVELIEKIPTYLGDNFETIEKKLETLGLDGDVLYNLDSFINAVCEKFGCDSDDVSLYSFGEKDFEDRLPEDFDPNYYMGFINGVSY